MKLFDNIKKKWQNYLKKMAKENKEAFGNERLDCCSMNKKDNK